MDGQVPVIAFGCVCGEINSRNCPVHSESEFTLGAKLELFDANCDAAVREIVAWLEEHPEDLIALARGRHVAGHYRYQEAGLFEYDACALLAEAAEELADAIVYLARRRHLTNS